MSDLIRCVACGGKKRYMGMGGIYKDCKPCKGIGWTEKPAITFESLEKAHQDIDKVGLQSDKPAGKKRGRKPKGE